MSIQPQVDLKIINDLLISQGKKTTDLFKLNRLDKAVSALEKNDKVQGYSARALYFNYINEPKEAIKFISNKINQFGNISRWLEAKFSIARKNGDWLIYKETFNEYFSKTPLKEVNLKLVQEYVHDLMLYIDDSNDLEEILNKINYSNTYNKIKELYGIRKSFDEYDLTLDTYRKILDISYSCIYKKYNVDTQSSLRFLDSIQIIHSCDLWTIDEAIELTKDINDAILSINNTEFQLEADEIEVFCINFDADKIPHDYSLYDDDQEDEELIKLVESRMNSNPEFEPLDV